MKKLDFEEMENTFGKKGCGKAGALMSVAGGVLGVVALAVPPVGLVGGLALAYGTAFGVAGIGCGLAELF